METLQVKTVIPFTVPVKRILARLGSVSEKTRNSGASMQMEQTALFMLKNITLQIMYIILPVSIEHNTVSIKDYKIESTLVSEVFSGAGSALVMASSACSENILQLEKYKKDDMGKAVIYDAVLSEAVDHGFLLIGELVQKELIRSVCRLGKRISCGYRDFTLNHQTFFSHVLNLPNYGIKLTPAYILQPEKSATALAPIFCKEV